jgi:two-component sensor histidine kinase
MVNEVASNAVDHGFDPWSGKTKNYKIGLCCFSDKHSVFRSKSKDRMVCNQDSVS